MNHIYKPIVLFFLLLMGGVLGSNAQTTITIGTSTNTIQNAAYHPYPTYYTSSRVQYIITAAELNAAGITVASNINSIGFNVAAAATGGASCDPTYPTYSVSNGQVLGYKISLKNTTQGMPISTYDFVGLTEVYDISSYTPISGWNTHIFSNSFAWDGVSNLLVDICVANQGANCSYCYTTNATTYYTPTTQNSVVSYWADSRGSFCGSSFPNACGQTPAGSANTYRPNTQMTFMPLAPPAPPTPNFQFTLGQDTLWETAYSTLINTSTNSIGNYWNITQYSATSSTGPWSTYNAPTTDPPLECNSWGCFIDTIKNNPNFIYSFASRGFYKVKLTTVNSYGVTDIEKIVFVDTPASKPSAMFFITRRQLGANDRSRVNNLSSNAPARVKWWLENSCTTCGADSNMFLPNDSAFSPVLAAYNPGTYTMCVAVSNSKGKDTFCRKDYIKILPGYLICHNEPERFDSVSREAQGYLYSDLRTATGAQLSGQFEPKATSPIGFRIAPCADTIYITLERLRMRTPTAGAGDSVYLRLNGFNGPIVRRWGGNNINILKDTMKHYKHAGEQLFVTYVPAVVSGTPPALVNDSGFTIRWSSSPSFFAKPTAGFTCPDTLYSGYKVRFVNQSTGNRRSFAWDLNNDGAYGRDLLTVGVDSITENPTITFTATVPTNKKVCQITRNCQGDDTFCRVLPLLPINNPPIANFITNRTSGFINDTFKFIDKSSNGALSWRWRFEPNNVTYLEGTDSTSQYPVISLNSPQYYNVTLVVSNQLGSSQITKTEVVHAIDYGSPYSAYPPENDISDFGIRRVVISGADNVLDTITPLKTPIYTRNWSTLQTTVYRGGKYSIDVYRVTAVDEMTLRVWADFNRDADYTDQNETIFAEDNALRVKTSFEFTVPASAEIGNSRILVGACNSSVSTINSTTATLGVYEDFGMIIGNDFVKPVVYLKGAEHITSELNNSFNDPGATAMDNIQGDVSLLIQTISNVDVTHLGFYTVKYYVTDLYGNTSDTVVRHVQVVIDNNGPTLTLIGSDSITVEVFADYTEPGYSAYSNLNEDITAQVQRTGTVDNRMVGNYTLVYSITDAYGIKAEKKRVVMVVDTQNPVVSSFSGKDTVVHQIGTAFDDSKYVQVTDNYWNNILPIRISGNINSSKVGSYTLHYRNMDGSGNVSAEYVLTVEVRNTIKPTIQLVGSDVVTVPVYGSYNDLGVVAKDYKGDLLTWVSDLNEKLRLDTISDADVIYTATDEFGESVSTNRKIFVRDLESPVIELQGNNPFVHTLGKPYTDAGVKVTDNFDPTVFTNSNKDDGIGIQVTIDVSKLNVNGAGFYYTVYVNAEDGSGNQAEEKKRLVYVTATGIEDVIQNAGFTVYPNPASHVLKLELNKGEIAHVVAYDVQGKAIALKTSLENKGYSMDISHLNSGLYILKIESTDGVIYSGKFNVAK
ncbi:MAG: immunoglobulin-like domain-containing protein [Bacteroidia bacterium]|jgi:PKD repeat protein